MQHKIESCKVILIFVCLYNRNPFRIGCLIGALKDKNTIKAFLHTQPFPRFPLQSFFQKGFPLQSTWAENL